MSDNTSNSTGGIKLEKGPNTGGISLEKVGGQPEPKRPMEVRGIKISMTSAVAIRFGFVGAGQGGSRIAECFHQFGYPTCVINTASQDLTYIKVPEDRKLCMTYGMGGAGKDIAIGADAFK